MAALREVALIAVNDMNAGGVLHEDHLWAMLAWVRMVALSGVRHGVALALAMPQLHSGHDLCLLELGFLVGVDEEKECRRGGHCCSHACRRCRPHCLL